MGRGLNTPGMLRMWDRGRKELVDAVQDGVTAGCGQRCTVATLNTCVGDCAYVSVGKLWYLNNYLRSS